ncbi:MAG: hypothetical protein Q27BB25_04820 [Blastomonas sp. CACIA14H2]|nr:MAG: hypothetical protein Q27BB25_04820 [Blastomonas sp. CACIA14H2]
MTTGERSQLLPERAEHRHPRGEHSQRNTRYRHSCKQQPVDRAERSGGDQPRIEPRRGAPQHPQHRRGEQAADQRAQGGIERDAPLEQPRNLLVRAAEQVHDVDRVGMRGKAAARREHDRGGGGEGKQRDQRDRQPAQRRDQIKHRFQPLAMRIDPRIGCNGLHRAAQPGQRGAISLRAKIDVDQRGQGDVAARRAAAQPWRQQRADLGLAHLGDARYRAVGTEQRLGGERLFLPCVAIGIDDLHRRAPGQIGVDLPRGAAQRQRGGGGEQREEQHHRDHPGHRPGEARLRDQPAIVAGGEERADHRRGSPCCGALSAQPVISEGRGG